MKVLLVGLDGATWTKLKDWMERGELPTFKKICSEYVHGNLHSTIPSYTSPALPTLFTGKNQAKTGIFGFFYADGTPVSLRTIKEPKIWTVLDSNGKRSCIVNVRMTFPAEKVNGVMISGNPAPSEDSDYVFPPELKERVKGFRHEKIDRLSEELTVDPQKNKTEILNYRITITKNRYQVFKKLNQDEDYDFSFFWIGGTDFMGHWFWDDDETFLKYFKEVDLILEDIIKFFKDRNIIIISDHGMNGVQKYKFYVNAWLGKNNFLKYNGNFIMQCLRKGVLPHTSFLFSRERKAKIIRLFKRFVQISVESKADSDGKKNPIEMLSYSSMHGIDWQQSKAYLINDWGIAVINTKTSEEYESLRDEIIEKLNNLYDGSGRKIVKKAWKREEIFSGQYLNMLPDIVFITTEDYGLSILPSFKITGRLNKDAYERKGGGRFFRGDHEGAIEAIIMAYGPEIREKHFIDNAKITDIMPTVLHSIGADIPWDVDGKALKELFKPDSETYKREVKLSRYDQIALDQREASEEENKAIINSLKQMGYI